MKRLREAYNSTVWIHESRWKTLLDDFPANNDVLESENTTSLHARQYYYGGYSYSYNTYYDYSYYGYGYGYYAKRELQKRWTCPSQSGFSSGRNSVSGIANEAAMYPFNGVARSGYAPKMNVYYDISCGSYMTSVVGSASCVISTSYIHGIRIFNQQL